MRIDIHTHFQSLDFIKHLAGRDALPRSVLDGGAYVIQCAAGLSVPALPQMIDMDRKLRDMDDLKIDVAVLSHGAPFGPDVLGGREADEWASRINDDLADTIAAYPGKFLGFGTIGFGGLTESISEVDRCIKQLGFRGIQIFSNIRNKPLDSPEFQPVFKHIAMLGAAIHLHPAIPLNRIGLDSARLYLPLGFPYDTSLNALRLIQCGLFDEAPDLKLIVAHCGGVLPYLKGRIATYNATLSPPAADRLHPANPIDDYLGKLYADSVCYHLEALECCYKVLGASRILYGTDHAFGRYNAPAELVDQLTCPQSDRELIYHGNAKRLLNIN